MTHFLGTVVPVLLGYFDYAIEGAVLLCLLAVAIRGKAKGLRAVMAYMLAAVGVGTLRMLAASRFGVMSHQYALTYWLSDSLIVVSVFLLICYFFRRASLGGAPKLWPYLRLMLLLVFVLTAGVASFTVLHHQAHFFPYFVLEFQDDLYFVCLVLTTMLYLLLMQYSPGDDQLGMLVCGLGITLAGFAATLALFHVAGSAAVAGAISGYINPLSDVGMTLVWLYTAIRVPYRIAKREARRVPKILPVGQLVHIS